MVSIATTDSRIFKRFLVKIYCVCKCGEHASDEASLEINFRDNTIYFVCPKCRKEYKMETKKDEGKTYS